MSKYNKEELENLILIQNLPYEAIGRMYGVTGNAIKKSSNKIRYRTSIKKKNQSLRDVQQGCFQRD